MHWTYITIGRCTLAAQRPTTDQCRGRPIDALSLGVRAGLADGVDASILALGFALAALVTCD